MLTAVKIRLDELVATISLKPLMENVLQPFIDSFSLDAVGAATQGKLDEVLGRDGGDSEEKTRVGKQLSDLKLGLDKLNVAKEALDTAKRIKVQCLLGNVARDWF